MKLRTKYILFVVIVHGLALGLSYFVFESRKVLFIASELLLFLSIFISWQLYNELITPLNLLIQGKEAIQDRDFNVKFAKTGKYEMDELIWVYNQMMDELRNERTKQEAQHLFLSKLIDTSPTGILILDFDEKIQQINPRAILMLGVEKKGVLGKKLSEISHPVIHQIQQLKSGQSRSSTFKGAVTYKLQKSHFIDRGFPRFFIMIEELTSEILAAEKNAYGKVIRMMAHEVNNTIGPVNSIIESVLQKKEHQDAYSNALEVAMERNNNLNIFMRNFADLVRIPMPDRKPLNLNLLIHRVADLMQLRSEEKKVDFRFDLAHPDLVILADLQQIEQVLINIVKNAIEAIETEGTITLITHALPREIIIRDTGAGIPASLESQLFSPFYSTKPEGQGVGLTLIREILVNHEFVFSLRTYKPGVTEFCIQF
jgi:two-component system, NtrC family, nitrogen regulation sensor histidine kinase NtrY